VPVDGLGEHTIQCSAANTAVAQDGSHGWSITPASTALKIGEPTISAISFTNIANKLRCGEFAGASGFPHTGSRCTATISWRASTGARTQGSSR
jgi:hypothetical protein